MKETFQQMRKKLDALPDQAYKEFVKHTPVRSGNARRNTKLTNSKKTIAANYGYAEKLDQGASKQSPDGMTHPVEEFIEKQFIKIMTGK